MKNFIVSILSLMLLTNCQERPCIGPFPDHNYFSGEKAIHVPTGETVRVVSRWGWLGGTTCQVRRDVSYTIRFLDGAEIRAEWNILKPM